jgi:hypothetical protein
MQYGLQVPAGPISEALRKAGAEAGARRFESAIAWQRLALEACKAEGLPAPVSIVVELTLASYLVHVAMADPSRAEEAAGALEAVIRGARRHGLDRERIHAKAGLATARALQGRYADAAAASLSAAAVAKQMNDPTMVGELLRSAGDSLFAAGEHARAVAVWRTSISYLAESDEDLALLDDRGVVGRLVAIGTQLGATGIVETYQAVLERMAGAVGAN